MKVKTKRLCLLTVAFLLFTSFALIFSATYKANAYTVPELSIVNGAYLRVVDTSDGDSAKASNGLRFVSYMDKQEYETLMAQSDITDVKFGILIAPDTATYILNENTVFSNDPTVKQYDWAIFNGETGKWDYSGDGTYKRIMNFSSDAMYENLEIGVESNVYFTGAIIGVKPENLANEWQGVGYMSYAQNGQVKYQFTNKVVRSLVYTAQVAIANVGENAPNSTVKGWLQANYVDGATTVASSYKTEYYLEQKDGTFALNETVVTSDGVTIDDVATPAPAKEIAGYVFDESNANNVLGETKVLANGKTVFKRYYLLTEVGLVDKTNAQEVNSVRSLDGYTAVVNKLVGAKATPIDATFNGNVLDVTSLDGTYNLVLTKGDQTITRTFDVYDSTQAPEWLDTLSMENLWGFRGTAGNSATTNYRNKVQYTTSIVELDEGQFYFMDGQMTGAGDADSGMNRGTPWCINVIAKHSKAYYEKFEDYALTFDYYLGTTGTDGYYTRIYGAFSTELEPSSRKIGWHSTSIPMSTLLEKWDIISGIETVSSLGHSMFDTRFETRFYNYLGNFVLDLQELESTDEVQLINVKDMDGVNVDEIVDEDVYKVIESANSTWSLTAVHTNTVYALTDGAINFKSVPYGAYTLTATTEKGKDVYSLNVDLYNSDKPEYNDIVSTDYVWGYRPTIANSVASETTRAKNTVEVVTLTETGHKGDYYATLGTSATAWLGTVIGYNVKSNHSKEYFELYKDYTVTFEYYLGDTKDRVSIYVATAFADAIPDKTAYGGDPFVGWYTAEIPVTTILEKWDVINQIDIAGVTGYANTMLSQNLTNSNNYTYFGNFKLEKFETLPTTAESTPAYNIVSRSVIKDDVWGLIGTSLIDGYCHSKGQYRLNVIEFTETDSFAGKTSGKYYSFDATVEVTRGNFNLTTAPYYEKSVYEEYLTANPNAVMSFEFATEQQDITNNIRRGWIKGLEGTSKYTNFIEVGQWYTITIPLKYIVDNYDSISTAGSSHWLIAFEAFDNRYTANGTQDTTLTAKQPTKAMMYFGNFTINANGTVGVVKQA